MSLIKDQVNFVRLKDLSEKKKLVSRRNSFERAIDVKFTQSSVIRSKIAVEKSQFEKLVESQT
jgi:hypothetical protein